MRVLVAESQRMMVDGLLRAFTSQPDIRAVQAVCSVEQLAELAPSFAPNVAVLDWRLAGGGGRRGISAVRACRPLCKVLVLADLDDVASVAEALGLGCDGFLTRDRGLEELFDAVRSVRDGEPVLSPAAASTLARAHRDADADAAPMLSARELEVVACLARGLTNREIADELYLSVHTVRNHLQRICRRLGARSRLEVVVMAAGQGLIELPQAV
jgi:DNA-binding NarL/FixJ family response regulator